MSLSKIDLNLFTVFDAIYKEGGITSASKRLHLSQPAVSHALGRLRELLNDPLFERHGNEMIPTPRARALATTIGGSLDSIEQLLHRVAHFDAAISERSFTVAMRESQEAPLLPGMSVILQREAPKISIATVRIEHRNLEDDLQSGSIDCAVDMAMSLSSAIFRKQLNAQPLVVLARKNHPVVGKALDLATYLSQGHILITGSRRGGGYVDASLSRNGLSRRISVRCQQHFAANEIVRQSDLLVTMARSQAEIVNRNSDNQMLPFPGELTTLELFIYWHSNIDEDPASKWFRAHVQSVLSDATTATV